MTREVQPGFFWIQECDNREDMVHSFSQRESDWYIAGREVHIPQNAWLFVGEKSLLFDTLSPDAPSLALDAVRSVLGDRPLDYLVISHPDVPHAGNTMKILRAWPNAQLVAPRFGDTHELYHLENALKVGPGDTLDLGGLVVKFHEATFLDAAMTLWMTEETMKVLLPVDWLGFPHLDGECLKLADEIDTNITVSRLTEFAGRVMFWFQYVDIARVHRDIDMLTEKFAGYSIAPSHGLVIRRDFPAYMEQMKDVVQRIADHGRLGVL
jgi:flavorubredoxin